MAVVAPMLDTAMSDGSCSTLFLLFVTGWDPSHCPIIPKSFAWEAWLNFLSSAIDMSLCIADHRSNHCHPAKLPCLYGYLPK